MPGDHLIDLSTSWMLISDAHTPGPTGQKAMVELVSRYHDAVERYLKLKLRDRNLADEIFQEFWTKVLSGKLAGADKEKGRFRDYVRTVLQRLIIDHFRSRRLQSLPPGDLLDPSGPDDIYEHVWRDAVLKRVRSRLQTYESQTPKNRYSTVLEMRISHPKAPIDTLATRLSEKTGTKVSPEAFRKTLQRSRAKFIELLQVELRETINPATDQDVEAEIHDLGLGYLIRRDSA